jgi:DNA polymerase-3 subunit delta
MEVKSFQAEKFITKPPADIAAVLVFGPDQGLVHERANVLARSIVPDLNDPFRISELDEARLTADPACLWDEAASLSMVGGRRVVRIRSAGNALAQVLGRFIAGPAGDALVIVEAGDLQKSSALRQVFTNSNRAAALGCYPDTAEDLEVLVTSVLAKDGLSIDPDALTVLVSRLGSDRGVTRSELEKLALYALGENRVTEAHINAILGDESALRIEEIADAAGLGEYVRLDRTLTRLWAAGTAAGTVLRRAMGHFQQILAMKEEIADGANAQELLKKQRPPIHFSRSRALLAQLSRWRRDKLLQALTLLYEAEALTRTTGIPEQAACSRALFTVAALAQAARQ